MRPCYPGSVASARRFLGEDLVAERIEATFLYRTDDGDHGQIIAFMDDEATGLRLTLSLDSKTTSTVRHTYDRPVIALAALQLVLLEWMVPATREDKKEQTIIHVDNPILVPGETDA